MIVRRVGPAAAALALPMEASASIGEERQADWLQDARLFALGWVGGLVFFGTFFS